MTDETPSVVKLGGRIDIRSIHESFEQIKSAAASESGLQIDLTEVTDVDLTFLQLMESLRRSALEAGTALRLCHPAGEPIRETLQRAGFLSDPPDERTLFWLAASGLAA